MWCRFEENDLKWSLDDGKFGPRFALLGFAIQFIKCRWPNCVVFLAAGDRLMDLTSREGDWFQDELHSMSGNVNQLLTLLNNNHVVRAIFRKYNLGLPGNCAAETLCATRKCATFYTIQRMLWGTTNFLVVELYFFSES